MREKKRAKREAAERSRAHDLRKSERYVPTTDDWAPSFAFDGTSYISAPRDGSVPMFVWMYVKLFRTGDIFSVYVSAWGNDDTSMIYRAESISDEAEAHREFDRWAKWLSDVALVSKKSLEQIGLKFD